MTQIDLDVSDDLSAEERLGKLKSLWLQTVELLSREGPVIEVQRAGGVVKRPHPATNTLASLSRQIVEIEKLLAPKLEEQERVAMFEDLAVDDSVKRLAKARTLSEKRSRAKAQNVTRRRQYDH